MATHNPAPPRGGPSTSAQPYLNWAIDTNFAYLRDGDWLPLLVEFTEDMTLAQFLRENETIANLDDQLRIPELFSRTDLLPDDFKFCVVLIRRSHAAQLTRDARWTRAIRRLEMGPPVNLTPTSISIPTCTPDPDPYDPPKRRVVVAVIDQGIAVAHPRFRYESPSDHKERTRVAWVWVQDASGRIDAATPGREIEAADIDCAVKRSEEQGTGEEKVYRELGVIDMALDGYKPLAHRSAHGTHVLDLASGYDVHKAPATRPIIAVEMPDAAVGDPAGSTLTVHAAWGLLYILWRAHGLLRPSETLPIVANISYGPHEGPHDGSSAFEQFVDALVEFSHVISTPMRVVLAAGNYRQSRTHAHFQLEHGAVKQLDWRLQPCGLTPSFMEIHFPSGTNVQVTLTPPGLPPMVISTMGPPATAAGQPPDLYTMEHVSTGSALESITLRVAPTAQDFGIEAGHKIVPCGVWIVEVKNNTNAAIDFDAWIKRSDTPESRRAKGRQSYFDDPKYRRHDANGRPIEFDGVDGLGRPDGEGDGGSYVQRRNTLSGIATGRHTFVIGAYRRGLDGCDLLPAFRSSQASGRPVPGRIMLGVNWLAPSSDGVACPGALGAGTRSGMRVAMSGTSVAAPQAVRYCADLWQGTWIEPGPVPNSGVLDSLSTRVPGADGLLVAGAGLMRLRPPKDRNWPSRREDWKKDPP